MAWDQLSINKPHLAYLILGGFTSLFMLCSLFVKEKLYIGEATVATLCGVIFGPHAANIFNPLSWGNTDQITLESTRVVLVVQCFAVGVELPKAYMERHWRSVAFLLVPVMTFGWLITSLFIWWMVEPLNWLESLICAACVTATDPVLASSIVGKGKFAKRVPRHLRDLLSAESGCNDGLAFPFIYLSFYLIHYKLNAAEVTFHWFCNTILYECVFGALYGFMIGYGGRHAIKFADRHDLVDRESFLVFYFVLALFCTGTGSTLGTDDLLVGFAAGVGFSNDGWFTQKTEESHVSNVIDLLLNLAYFVYFGSIIPWEQFNNPAIGLTPWRLVVIAILVLFFRRIPIVLALKPVVPDIKTWREALFAGHFGPMGVGAIFAAILARAELETDSTTPLAIVPTDTGSENYAVIQVIWPLTTFIVVTSILVHGSSVAVFTLGKRINAFSLTMSYTQANEEGPSWMNRLPRMANSTRQSMSKGQDDYDDRSSEKDFPPGELPPVGLPGNFLRRQKEEDTTIEKPRSARRRFGRDSGLGAGGHVEESAIRPHRSSRVAERESSTSDVINEKNASTSEDESESLGQENVSDRNEKDASEDVEKAKAEAELEVYDEGDNLVVEDEEGNIVGVHPVRGKTDAEKARIIRADEKKVQEDDTGYFAKGSSHPHTAENETSEIESEIEEEFSHPKQVLNKFSNKLGRWSSWRKDGAKSNTLKDSPSQERSHAAQSSKAGPQSPPEESRLGQAAHAYQFGQTLIIEDEDGEVIKKIDLGPKAAKRGFASADPESPGSPSGRIPIRRGIQRVGTWAGIGAKHHDLDGQSPGSEADDHKNKGRVAGGKTGSKFTARRNSTDDDDRLRFTLGTGGQRMSKQEFVRQLQQLDPKARRQAVDATSASKDVKDEIKASVAEKGASTSPVKNQRPELRTRNTGSRPAVPAAGEDTADEMPIVRRLDTVNEPNVVGHDEQEVRPENANDRVPISSHDVHRTVQKHAAYRPEETAAQRRRRMLLEHDDSDDDGTERVPPKTSTSEQGNGQNSFSTQTDLGETAAERRRRLAALGIEIDHGDESKEENEEAKAAETTMSSQPIQSDEQNPGSRKGIRFADGLAPSHPSRAGSSQAVNNTRKKQ